MYAAWIPNWVWVSCRNRGRWQCQALFVYIRININNNSIGDQQSGARIIILVKHPFYLDRWTVMCVGWLSDTAISRYATLIAPTFPFLKLKQHIIMLDGCAFAAKAHLHCDCGFEIDKFCNYTIQKWKCRLMSRGACHFHWNRFWWTIGAKYAALLTHSIPFDLSMIDMNTANWKMDEWGHFWWRIKSTEYWLFICRPNAIVKSLLLSSPPFVFYAGERAFYVWRKRWINHKF